MAAATIRLGKISSINYTAGKARVVYEDRDDSVTSELPFLALQYNIPKVDDLVVVACFSNGTVSGVILGPVYNSANTPHEGGAGIFRQEMSNNVNEAVMSYSEKKQTIILRAPKIEFEGYGYEDKPYVTLEQINDAFSDIDDNKTGISNLQDDTAKTKGKPSLQAQLDALEKRVKALGVDGMGRIGNFGKLIVFETSDSRILNFTDYQRTISANWAKHERIGKKPQSEFLNPELMTVQFKVVLNAQHGVKPWKTFHEITKAVQQGRVEKLVIGNHAVGSHKWKIMQATQSNLVVMGTGEIQKMDVNLSLEEYL